MPYDLDKGLVGPVFRSDSVVGAMGIGAGETGADMGYMFARAQWGRGYATEIGCALLAAACSRFNWPAIEACVFDVNPASKRVLEKLEFTGTGTCEESSTARGATLPARKFRLARPSPVSSQETGPKSSQDFDAT